MSRKQVASHLFVICIFLSLKCVRVSADMVTPTPSPTPIPSPTWTPAIFETSTPIPLTSPDPQMTPTPVHLPTPSESPAPLPTAVTCSAEYSAFLRDLIEAIERAETALMVNLPLLSDSEVPLEHPGFYGNANVDIEFLAMVEIELLEEETHTPSEAPTAYPIYASDDIGGNSMVFGLPPQNAKQRWKMERLNELKDIIDRHTLKIQSLMQRRAAVAAALGAPDTTAESLRLTHLEATNRSLTFDLAAMLAHLASIDNPFSRIYTWTWDPVCGGAISNYVARVQTTIDNLSATIEANNTEIEKLRKKIAGRPQELIEIDTEISRSQSIITQSEEIRARVLQR